MKILVLNQSEIVELLPPNECIEVMRKAFAAVAAGQVYQPLRNILRVPEAKGLLGLMPSYTSGVHAAYGLKAVCVFPENPTLGKDTHQGGVLLFSAETGELLSVMNASAITAIRTAAVSAVATDLLARGEAETLAILGSGVQSRAHLSAIAEVRNIKQCRVASKSLDHAAVFAKDMQPSFQFPIEAADSVEEAVRNADLIVAATNTVEPIIKRQWIASGAHLNLVGSCFPHTREVDGATMAACSLFVDSRESTMNESGDYIIALREGSIQADHIKAELSELVAGTTVGRGTRDEITIFKSLGLAFEDLFAAEYLYRKAAESGAGTWVDF